MTTALHKIWCDEDEHFRYEHFADFNEWLDSEEGQAAQVEYGVDTLPQPLGIIVILMSGFDFILDVGASDHHRQQWPICRPSFHPA